MAVDAISGKKQANPLMFFEKMNEQRQDVQNKIPHDFIGNILNGSVQAGAHQK